MFKNIFRRENLGFGGLQWFYWSGICTVAGYLVVYLKSVGYNEFHTGVVLAAIAASSILGQPFWGSLCDRTGYMRNIIVLSLSVSAVAALIIPIASGYFIFIVLLCSSIAFTENSMPAVIDSWTLGHKAKKPWIDYGLTRGMGSLGFALTAVFMGIIIDRYGFNSMFYTHFIFIVFAIGFCFFIQPPGENPDTPKADNRGKIAISDIKIKDSKKFIWLLLSSTIAFTGFRATMFFFPLLLTEKGGDNSHLGLALFIMASSEFPVLFFSGKLLEKFKDTTLITVAMFFLAVRIFLHIVTGSVEGLILIQATQGLSFALFLPASVFYIRRIAPPGLSSTYLTVATSSYLGIGGILGSFFGGLIIDRAGIYPMLWICLLTCIAGLSLFVFSGPNRKTAGISNAL